MAHVAPAEYAHHGREEIYANYHPEPFDQSPSPPPDAASVLADALAALQMPQSARGRTHTPPPDKDLVVHAIEAAAFVLNDQASALRDQISENERLRSAISVRERELQNYKLDQVVGSRHTGALSHDESQAASSMQHMEAATSESHGLMQGSDQHALRRDVGIHDGISGGPQSSVTVHPDPQTVSESHYPFPPSGMQGEHHRASHGFNGYSHISQSGISRVPISRRGREAVLDGRTLSGYPGNAQYDTNTANSSWMQEFVQRNRMPEEEIKHLKRLLADASVKEMQLVHENNRLEKQLSVLYLNMKKYQQELANTTSRAMSLRQDLLMENAKLTTELRVADQDIDFYATSFLPLLAEFNLQPATRDTYSIVSGVKALVQHLRDEVTKGSLVQKQSWQNSPKYQSSPRLETRALDIVPHPPYAQPERPLSPTSPLTHTPREWQLGGIASQHHPISGYNYSDVTRPSYSWQAGESPFRPSHRASVHYGNAGHLPYDSSYINSDEDPNTAGHSNGPESHEKEEDPLPDIEGLAIHGEAVVGKKINATGTSINGTALCHFQWVRHYRDGRFYPIPGAAQPEYTITADDYNTILSLECTPMDDQNRKGNMVQVFVNDQNWISLEMEMKERITEYLKAGQAIFDVKLVAENSQEIYFEPAQLALKQSLYELKQINGKKTIASERYAAESVVEIEVVKDSQCCIFSSSGATHLLECNDSWTRDLVVMTMHEFIGVAADQTRARTRPYK